jgi:hypothetical protein
MCCTDSSAASITVHSKNNTSFYCHLHQVAFPKGKPIGSAVLPFLPAGSIRGDTPSSHALLSSVRAGCIPVIICDLCSRYSPSFKSSLTIEDFSVTIDEHKFLQDPLGELLKLQEMMTTFEIEEKLKWLAYAQRITQPDHPKSLFVPAYVYESLKAAQ